MFNKLIDLLNKVSPIIAKKFRVKSRVSPRKKLDLEINERDILFLKKTYNEIASRYRKEFSI